MKIIQWTSEFQVMLKVHFTYDPETGVIVRRFPTKRSKAGPLTSRTNRGALQTNITWRGELYNIQLHRLAYFLHTGQQPREVLHKDGDRGNNKFSNLFAVMTAEEIVEQEKSKIPEPAGTASPNESEYAMNIAIKPLPVPVAKVSTQKKKAIFVSEVAAGMLERGEATVSTVGGAVNEHGEILPSDYEYHLQNPEEKFRVRRGWAIYNYYKKIDAYGMTQEEKDKEAGLEPRLPRAGLILPLYHKWTGKPFPAQEITPEMLDEKYGALTEQEIVSNKPAAQQPGSSMVDSSDTSEEAPKEEQPAGELLKDNED